MGFELLTFTIKNITDCFDYLMSWNLSKLAIAKQNARMSLTEAETNSDLKVSGVCLIYLNNAFFDLKNFVCSKIVLSLVTK